MPRFPVKCARLRPAACRPDPSQTGWTSRPPPFLQQFFLFCHISKLALRVPLVFTKKHGIYAARLMLRLRLAFTNRTYYTMTPPQAASTKPHSLRFCMVQCFQAHAQKRIGARSARSRASGGLEVIIPWRREAVSTKPRLPRFCMVQCSQAHAQKRIGARSARSRASGGLEGIIP